MTYNTNDSYTAYDFEKNFNYMYSIITRIQLALDLPLAREDSFIMYIHVCVALTLVSISV